MAIWCSGIAGRLERGFIVKRIVRDSPAPPLHGAQRRSDIIWALALAALIVTLAMAAA
jgi:hypothetical protein